MKVAGTARPSSPAWGRCPGEHGRTGFIVETVDEMVDAARHIDEIDPAECRRAVQERFGISPFVAAHEKAYLSMLDEGPAWSTLSLPGPLV
jgi:hypothetical protein